MRYLNYCFIISKQTLLNKFNDERIHEEDMMARTASMDFLANKIAPFGEKVAAQRHLKALREGVLMAMPLVLVGSIFTLIGSFPIEAWTTWLNKHGELDVLLNTMANNTFGLVESRVNINQPGGMIQIDIKEDGTLYMTGTVGYIADMTIAEGFFS